MKLPRHQLDFADTLKRPVSVVLGLPLRPYSIGMELELLRARSPFVLPNPEERLAALTDEEKRAALITAVDICSQSESERAQTAALLNNDAKKYWQECSVSSVQCSGRQAFRFPLSAFRFIRFRLRKRKLDRIWVEWEKMIQKMDFKRETALFWDYLRSGKTGPEYAKPASDTPTVAIGAPECAILLQYIWGLPASRVTPHGGNDLDYPLALARYELATRLEQEGKVQLKSDHVDDFDDWVKEQESAIAAGKFRLPPCQPNGWTPDPD